MALNDSFSILTRIDLPVTPLVICVSAPLSLTFSILKRIDLPVTAHRASIAYVVRFFQYPQTDRFACNSMHSQHRHGITSYFQYPQTDRFACNCTASFGWNSDTCQLSVSSHGSICL